MINGQKVDKIDIIPVPGKKTCQSRESRIFESETSSIPGKRGSRIVKKNVPEKFFGKKNPRYL